MDLKSHITLLRQTLKDIEENITKKITVFSPTVCRYYQCSRGHQCNAKDVIKVLRSYVHMNEHIAHYEVQITDN